MGLPPLPPTHIVHEGLIRYLWAFFVVVQREMQCFFSVKPMPLIADRPDHFVMQINMKDIFLCSTTTCGAAVIFIDKHSHV